MEFKGTWDIEGTNETLKISGPIGEDQYFFEFSNKSKADEKVSIFPTNERYALLAKSKVYGRADVFIYDKNTFAIDEQKFCRVEGK